MRIRYFMENIWVYTRDGISIEKKSVTNLWEACNKLITLCV